MLTLDHRRATFLCEQLLLSGRQDPLASSRNILDSEWWAARLCPAMQHLFAPIDREPMLARVPYAISGAENENRALNRKAPLASSLSVQGVSAYNLSPVQAAFIQGA